MHTALDAPLFRPWMRTWLLAAGLYNLLWGAWVVLAPDALFNLVGMDPLAGPS